MMGTNVFTGKAEDYDSLASYGAQPNQYQSQSELENLELRISLHGNKQVIL